MKTLSTRQTELTERRDVAFVQLMKLTTFTDRGAETVDTVYYFADRSLLYDYGNTGTDRDFSPFLMRSDPVASGMEQLASQSSGLVGSQLQKELRLTLRNGQIDDGTRLAVDLRTHNLEFARVELAQLPVDLVQGEGGFDLRSLTGDEHVVWFRGELEQVEGVTPEEISLRFVTELPQIPWYVHADAAKNHPQDFGKRGNIVYGDAKRVPGLTIDTGETTTLTTRMTLTQQIVLLSDTANLPDSGNAKIGSEEVSWTGRTGSGLTGMTRGANGTTAKRHAAGEVFVELATIIVEFAHHESATLGDVFVLSPFNGELVKIRDADVTLGKSTADTTSLAGETITSITIVFNEVRKLLDLMATQAAEGVGQQPVTTHAVTQTRTEQPTSGQSQLRDGNLGTNFDVLAQTQMTFADPGGPLTRVTARIFKTSTTGNSGTTDIRVGTSGAGAIVGQIVSTDPVGWYTFETTTGLGNIITVDCIGARNLIVSEVERVVEFDGPSPSTSNTVIDGDSGFGLRFFADVQGYKVPAADTNFKVSAGTLIQHPTDIRRHLIAILAGLGHGAIDATTFDATETDLGGNVHYAILNELGEDFATINATLDAETRSQLVLDETASGSVYKLYAALSTYAWPAKSKTVTLWQGFSEEGRDGRTLFTRFRALYDLDRSIGASEDGARALLRVDVGQNDINATVPTAELTTAEQKFGRRDHPGMLWLTHRNAATAEEVLGYHVTELKRVAPIYAVQGVPWVEGYAIERGDIVGVTPPWETSERKCRVLEYVKNWDSEMVDLRVVEVP